MPWQPYRKANTRYEMYSNRAQYVCMRIVLSFHCISYLDSKILLLYHLLFTISLTLLYCGMDSISLKLSFDGAY